MSNLDNLPTLADVRHTLRQKWDMVPEKVARQQRRKEKQDALDAAYRVVDKRDGNKCRVTGNRLQPDAVDSKFRREHNHIKGRRVRPEWREDPDRIFLVSAFVHDLITRGWIAVEGLDASKSKVLRFHWTELATSRPIRIRSRRRSQN